MSKTLAWYTNKQGSFKDVGAAQLAHYRSKTGLTTGSINDNLFKLLGTLGYTGSLNDRLRAFYKFKTGSSSNDFDYLENLFHSNNTYDFV